MMSSFFKGLSYCRQITTRLATKTFQQTANTQQPILKSQTACLCPQLLTTRSYSDEAKPQSLVPPYVFKVKSPYKNPGPRRYGYRQKLYDGGPLPRGLVEPVATMKKYKDRKTWSNEKALCGRNDYIDILSDSGIQPADLIKAPAWIRGFNGNEMQRILRRMRFEGHRMKQLYPTFHHSQQKRISFLYKKYNQKRGKRIR